MDNTLSHSRYALVIRIPREIEVQIEDTFLTLVGITRPIIGFHITLVGPFLWESDADSSVLDQLAQICESFEPFQVTIGGSGAFVGEDASAVYIAVEHSAALRELQARAHRLLYPHIALQREIAPEEYIPHVTLGLGLTPEERDRALVALSNQPITATLQVVELHLVEQKPQSPWRLIRTFPLAGQPPPGPHRIHEE